MKKHVLFILLLVCTVSIAKPKGMGYADAQFKPSTEAKANYYVMKKYRDTQLMPTINPTGDGFIKGYGISFDAPMMTGLDYYVIEHYDANDTKVLDANALVERATQEYMLDGSAVFYYPNGKVKATGNFSNFILTGRYSEFDQQGQYIGHKYYTNGEVFTPSAVDERLLGKWKANYQDDEHDYFLFNEIYANGRMLISSQLTPYDYGFGLTMPEPSNSNGLWHYKKTGKNSGQVILYDYAGKKIAVDNITFTDANTFRSKTVANDNPEEIGKIYEFKRVATDKRLLGLWKADYTEDGNKLSLYNELFDDGVMLIWSQPRNLSTLNRGNATVVEWTYEKIDDNTGKVVVFTDGGLSTDLIEFIDNNTFNSIVVDYTDNHAIGGTYRFRRVRQAPPL